MDFDVDPRGPRFVKIDAQGSPERTVVGIADQADIGPHRAEVGILVGIVAAGIAGALILFSGNVTTAIDTLGGAVGALRPPATPSLTP